MLRSLENVVASVGTDPRDYPATADAKQTGPFGIKDPHMMHLEPHAADLS